jgi:hypothetical protein
MNLDPNSWSDRVLVGVILTIIVLTLAAAGTP